MSGVMSNVQMSNVKYQMTPKHIQNIFKTSSTIVGDGDKGDDGDGDGGGEPVFAYLDI